MKGHAGNDKMIAERAGVSHRHGGPGAPRPAVCEGGGPAAGAGGDGGAGLPANRVASALATSGMARHFAIIQPTWESYVGEAMAAGVRSSGRTVRTTM